MGAWGEKLFESDEDLDIADMLALEAGVDSMLHPDNADVTRHILKDGDIIQQMFDRRQKMRPQPKYEPVILGALAMMWGCRISASHMKLLKRVNRQADSSNVKKTQMKDALRNWKNDGLPWEFDRAVGMVEAIERKITEGFEGQAGSDCEPGPSGAVKRGNEEIEAPEKAAQPKKIR